MYDHDLVRRHQQRQLGLLTSGQASEAGLTPKMRHRMLRTGELVQRRRGVYASAAVKPTAAQAVLAAILAVDGLAWASHLTSGAHWGLKTPPPDEIHLLTTHGTRVRLAGVVHHRTKILPPQDIAHLRGVPCTGLARTLVDCLPWLGEAGFAKAADDARRRGLLPSYDDLDRCLQTIDHGGKTGRHLVVPARVPVAKRVAGGRQAGGSEREVGVLDVLERAGVRLPQQQVVVTLDGKTYKLDHAYPEEKVLLEWEGWAEHGLVFETFHRDRPRNNRLRLAGWLLLQFTAESTEDDIVRDVTAALALRATMAG